MEPIAIGCVYNFVIEVSKTRIDSGVCVPTRLVYANWEVINSEADHNITMPLEPFMSVPLPHRGLTRLFEDVPDYLIDSLVLYRIEDHSATGTEICGIGLLYLLQQQILNFSSYLFLRIQGF